MSITHRKLTMGLYLIELSGPLNVNQAAQVSECFKALAAQDIDRVVVNLSDVPFIDGPGLAALIAGYRLFSRNRQSFRLAGPQDQPKLVLELTGFDHIFQIIPSVTEETADGLSYQPLPHFKVPASVPFCLR